MTTTLNLSLAAELANRACRAACRKRRADEWVVNIYGCKSRRNEAKYVIFPLAHQSFDRTRASNSRKNGEIISPRNYRTCYVITHRETRRRASVVRWTPLRQRLFPH